MVNKQFDNVVITESITDAGGVTHTGSLSESGGSGGANTSWSTNGSIAASSDALLQLRSVSSDATLTVSRVTAVRSDGTALPSNTSIVVGHIDNGGSLMSTTEVVAGDASTRHIDVNADVSYSPANETESVAVVLQNDSSSEITAFTSGQLEVE